ncbi:MAG: transcription antitermination factor NusB [Actinomycetota bacterium]
MNRRGARKLALDVLYEQELSGAELEAILQRYRQNPGHEYAAVLSRGVNEHREALDELISGHSRDWKIERMPVVDRSLLRIALYEIGHQPEVPVAVAINEAVELAKTYSTDDSSRFVNGLLAAASSGDAGRNVDNLLPGT